jgi:hypothetical protein
MSRAFVRHALLKNIDTRLETFKYTIYEPNSSTFAENGLYYQNNALICFSCGGGTVLTDISENYESLHYTECQFTRELDVSIRIPNEIETEYCACKPDADLKQLYPNITSKVFGDIRAATPLTKTKFKLQTIAGILKRDIEAPQKQSVLNVRSFYLLMRNEFNRCATFNVMAHKFPHKFLNCRELARAGFYYTLIKDIICCYVCRVCFGGLTRNSNIIDLHKRFSPNCILGSEDYQITEYGIFPEKKCNENLTLECKICYKRNICTVFDCNHLMCCHVCARLLIQCPLCRSEIRSKREIIIN